MAITFPANPAAQTPVNTFSPTSAPPAPPEPTAAEKLAAAGLTVEELKALLS